MQRLARTPIEPNQQNALAFLAHFAEIKQLLAKHLPPSTLKVFAEPVVKTDVVEWYSSLEGQPVKLTEKQQDEKLLSAIQNKLTSIQNLVSELKQQNAISPEKAALIQQLLTSATHNTKEIYVVNGEPVIVGWGLGKVVEPPPPVIPPVATVPFWHKHLWCLLLLPLLLLLLGFLLWWFLLKAKPETAPPVKEPVKQEVVKQPEPEKVPEPVKIPEPVKELEPVKEIEPEKTVEKEKPVPVEEVKVPQPEPKKEEKVVEPPKKPAPICTKSITPEKRPQMVMVFDNSASMLLSLSETKASIDAFNERWDTVGITQAELDYMRREPRRLTVAKSSASTIIDKIDKNIDIGLVSLTYCPSTSHGFYSPGKRAALKQKIRSMYPDTTSDNAGTALYDGLQKAASMVDGKNRDAFILLISDGEDSCNKDQSVCSLAKQLAKSKPKLKINVVDIGNTKAANCAASATGGKVFTAQSKQQVSNMINRAIQPMIEKEECK